jgi:putative ATPase
MKNIGYGKDYKYAHSFEGNFVNQDFLPDAIRGTKIYDPGNNARENEAKEKLKKLWGERYEY